MKNGTIAKLTLLVTGKLQVNIGQNTSQKSGRTPHTPPNREEGKRVKQNNVQRIISLQYSLNFVIHGLCKC